jgi:peptidoglycan/LPS O-acetylase OafA/YrhL
MTPSSESRVAALDGLRGSAILAVLFSHLTVYSPIGDSGGHWLGMLAELGSRGVDLFFALSGYLIFQRLRHTRNQAGCLPDFWLRRAAKILPLYFGLLAGVYLVLPSLLSVAGFTDKLSLQSGVAGHWPWYAGLVSNALNALQGRFTNPALDVSWSLAVEVQFYIVVAFIFTSRLGGGSRGFWLAMGGMALGVRIGAVMLGLNWIQILVLTPARLDAFAAGIVLALGAKNFPRWLRCLGLAGIFAAAFPFWSRLGTGGQTLGYTWLALGCSVLIDRALNGETSSLLNRFLTTRPLRLMGALSYSLYLTHVPVRAALRDIFLPSVRLLDSGSAWVMQGLFYLGAGGICVLVAALVWHFVEKPARTLILQLASRSCAVS